MSGMMFWWKQKPTRLMPHVTSKQTDTRQRDTHTYKLCRVTSSAYQAPISQEKRQHNQAVFMSNYGSPFPEDKDTCMLCVNHTSSFLIHRAILHCSCPLTGSITHTVTHHAHTHRYPTTLIVFHTRTHYKTHFCGMCKRIHFEFA